jgi:carboxypeptidase PM20D1
MVAQRSGGWMMRWFARGTLVVLSVLLVIVSILLARSLLPARPAAVAALQLPQLTIDSGAASRRLAAAIRFETVSLDGQPQAARAALEAMQAWLMASYPGFHAVATRTVIGGGTLIYEWRGTDPALEPIILMAHQDVVPVEAPQHWRHPPFAGVIAEGHIWGRGSIDDKSSLIAILEAAEGLAASGFTPRRTLLLVFGHDEETGGSGARAAAQHLHDRGVEAQFVLDEGSLVVADHPVTGRAVALIGISEKGFATVRVTARARGGHASMPPEDTAVAVLARAIDAIVSRPFPRRYEGATRAMLQALARDAPFVTRMAIANEWLLGPLLQRSLAASPQGAAMLHTTIAPTMLSGSPKQNVLPAEAIAILNLRIAPGDTVAGVLAHLRASVQGMAVDVTLEGQAQEPSSLAMVDTPGFALLAGAARGVFDVAVAPAPVIAATDSRHMAQLGRDTYRFQPLQLALEETGMIHGADERLAIGALEKMIRFYGAVIAGSN